MKRFLVSLLVCVLFLSCIGAVIAEEILPFAIPGNFGSTTISINGQSGTAAFSVKLNDGDTVESPTITIQKKVNGTWSTIKTYVGDSRRFSTSFSAPAGYSYKAYTRYTIVAANGASESYVCYSGEYSN